MGSRSTRWLAYLPLAVAIAEILLFVAVGQWLGFGWAILLYLATSALGVMIISREGSRSWAAMKELATTGRMPAPAPGDPGSRILGGLLLTMPGLLSDVAGLVLLLPPVQAAMARRRSHLGGPRRSGGFGGRSDVVEGEVLDHPADPTQPGQGEQDPDTSDPGTKGPRGRELEE